MFCLMQGHSSGLLQDSTMEFFCFKDHTYQRFLKKTLKIVGNEFYYKIYNSSDKIRYSLMHSTILNFTVNTENLTKYCQTVDS